MTVDHAGLDRHIASGIILAASIWLSLALGLIFLILGLRFGSWAITSLTGGTYSTGVTWGVPVNPGDRPEGTPVSYWELPDGVAWTEAALFLFGLALLLEGITLTLALRAGPAVRRAAMVVALLVTGAATLLNLGVSVHLFRLGVTPLMSLLMVAFGGYLCFQLAGMLVEDRRFTASAGSRVA